MDPTSDANVIAGISLFVSVLTFFFYFKDRRREKFQLGHDYVKQLIEWHGETVEVLINLRGAVSKSNDGEKSPLLCKLSSQIEKGRFFFPNIDKMDDFGKEKPLAYQGYRNLTLDFLVYSYNLFSRKDASKYLKHAEVLQREFTSIVFQIVRPREHLEEIKQLTDKFYASDSIFEDYLDKDPTSIQFIHYNE